MVLRLLSSRTNGLDLIEDETSIKIDQDLFVHVFVLFKVLKQRRELDAALFSELHRKLQTQVSKSRVPVGVTSF